MAADAASVQEMATQLFLLLFARVMKFSILCERMFEQAPSAATLTSYSRVLLAVLLFIASSEEGRLQARIRE